MVSGKIDLIAPFQGCRSWGDLGHQQKKFYVKLE